MSEADYELSFELGTLPPMGNVWGRQHGFKKDRTAKAIYQEIWFKVSDQRPKTPLKFAKLILCRHSSSEPDYDGLVMSFKIVVDGLVRAGILENDRLSNTGQWEVTWKKSKPKQGKVTVTIFGRAAPLLALQ